MFVGQETRWKTVWTTGVKICCGPTSTSLWSSSLLKVVRSGPGLTASRWTYVKALCLMPEGPWCVWRRYCDSYLMSWGWEQTDASSHDPLLLHCITKLYLFILNERTLVAETRHCHMVGVRERFLRHSVYFYTLNLELHDAVCFTTVLNVSLEIQSADQWALSEGWWVILLEVRGRCGLYGGF